MRDTWIITVAGLLAGNQTAHFIWFWAKPLYPNNCPVVQDIDNMLWILSREGLIEKLSEPINDEAAYRLPEKWEASFSLDFSGVE